MKLNKSLDQNAAEVLFSLQCNAQRHGEASNSWGRCKLLWMVAKLFQQQLRDITTTSSEKIITRCVERIIAGGILKYLFGWCPTALKSNRFLLIRKVKYGNVLFGNCKNYEGLRIGTNGHILGTQYQTLVKEYSSQKSIFWVSVWNISTWSPLNRTGRFAQISTSSLQHFHQAGLITGSTICVGLCASLDDISTF